MNAGRRRAGSALVAAAALVALSACSSSDSEPKAEPSSTASTEKADPKLNESAGCKLLTAKERAALLGSTLDAITASDAKTNAVQCRWDSDKGLIQVTDLAAQDWAKTLPNIVAEMEKSADLKSATDKAQLAKAKKLLEGAKSFTGKQACEAFSTLAEIGGDKAGTTTTVTYLPISDTTIAISAQICTGGRLTSLVFSTPELKKSKAYERKVTIALKAAHKRAVAAA